MSVRSDLLVRREFDLDLSFTKAGDYNFGRNIITASVAAFFVALLVGASCYITIQQLNELHDQSLVSQELVLSLSQLLQTVNGAESAQRGFIITGNKSYLQPYSVAQSSLPGQIDHLSRLVPSGNDASLALLIAEINTKQADHQSIETAIRTKGANRSDLVALTDRSNKAMARISDRILGMILQQENMFKDLENERAKLYSRVLTLVSGLITFELLLCGISALTIGRNRAARLDSDRLLNAKNALLRAQRDEFKSANDQLTVVSARFESLFRNIPVACIYTDSKGSILEWNQTSVSQFGYTREEALRSTIFQTVVPPRNIVRARKAMTEVMAGQSLSGMEWICLTKKGEEREMFANLIPLLGEDGSPLGTIAAMIDITERKAVELLKNEFVSTVSHELRTPLTSIRGALGLVCSGATGTLSDKALRLCAIANSNTERLVHLINDILDMEKIESGNLGFNNVDCCIADVVKMAIEENRGFADQFQMTVALKAKDSNTRVYADPVRLNQVMNNLLSNAVKFSPNGCEIVVEVHRAMTGVIVSVEDCGPGIPEEFSHRVFDRFAQADSGDTREKGGTGLGLSISKAIIEHLGGRIWFDTFETGTRFSFYLTTALSGGEV